MRYALGERFIEQESDNTADVPSIFLTTSSEAREIVILCVAYFKKKKML